VAGDGETIEAGADVLDAEVPAVDGEAAAELDLVWDAGLALSLGMPPANGLRGRLTSSACRRAAASARSAGAVPTAAWGAGASVTSAPAFLRSTNGTATIASTRIATTGQSLRSSRSRRSEFMIALRSRRWS
jgi:hypothetical protein